MRAIKQNTRCTKKKKKPITVKLEGDKITPSRSKTIFDIYVSIDDAPETMYTNQTNAFSMRSMKGNRYVMILYEIDNNFILSEAMKNRTSGETIQSYQVFIKRLKTAGIKTKKNVLYNECSE